MSMKRRELLAAAGRVAVLVAMARGGLTVAHAGEASVFDSHEAATLQRIAWLLFPFDGLGQAPYQRVVGAMARQHSEGDAIAEGIAALDELAGGRFLDRTEQEQVELLREIQSGGFFGKALESTRNTLLHDEELWAQIGYEGSSMAFGGYLDRGLEDIDWLPEFPETAGGGHD